jgi:hypothetical protein
MFGRVISRMCALHWNKREKWSADVQHVDSYQRCVILANFRALHVVFTAYSYMSARRTCHAIYGCYNPQSGLLDSSVFWACRRQSCCCSESVYFSWTVAHYNWGFVKNIDWNSGFNGAGVSLGAVILITTLAAELKQTEGPLLRYVNNTG